MVRRRRVHAPTTPQTGEIGNGIPAAVISYSGVVEGSTMDGAIVAGAIDGDGFIFNVFGAAGSLEGVSDDLDTMLAHRRAHGRLT